MTSAAPRFGGTWSEEGAVAAMNLAMTLRAKGGAGTAERVGTILSRFGLTESQMARSLARYLDLAERYGAYPTLPITARVLARHPAMIRRLVDRGVEFAIHGLVHNDHASLGLDEQRASITEAAALFRAARVPFSGFRAPYLRANSATDEAVRSLGLRYHSSRAVAFAALPERVTTGARGDAYRRALQFYGALDAARQPVRPRAWRGLIDIPVAVPDDEIMVDRLRLDERAKVATWLAMLDQTYDRGDLFTLQLHPERIHDCAGALEAVLAAARQRTPPVWTARLADIAGWWTRRGTARLAVEPVEPNCYRVSLSGPEDARLVVRGAALAGVASWFGDEQLLDDRSLTLRSAVKPVVGVSGQSPATVLEFLREEGYPTELADDPRPFAVHLDVRGDQYDEIDLLQQVARARGPIARLARWPNGARAALAVTGDIDSITLQDFGLRLWETRASAPVRYGDARSRGTKPADPAGSNV